MQGAIRKDGTSLYLEEVGPEHSITRMRLKKLIHRSRSPFQQIEVAESYDYGRLLVLDGCVNVAERDEANYHEMIAHIPTLLHPDPQRVLVIGGGDGGTVRELIRHPSIRHIDLVEIDREVIAVSKKYFPGLAGSFHDPRVHVHYEDGVAFTGSAVSGDYSLVIVDSSDPDGPGKGLFTRTFCESCRRCLSEDGILVAQSESPYIFPEILRETYNLFADLFPHVYPYRTMVPSYPSGQIYFMLGGKKDDPQNVDLPMRTGNFFSVHGSSLSYLNPRVLSTVFTLPEDCRRVLRG
jgi:spermidine synthase